MSVRGVWAIYKIEMKRALRTIGQTILSPVLTTMLYFVVFGPMMGQKIGTINSISYSAFLVPGLIMLTVLSQSVSNAAFGIYLPKFTGSIYEILSSPLSFFEIMVGFVSAAMTKSLLIAGIVLGVAMTVIDFDIQYPALMCIFLLISCFIFSFIGFVVGVFAGGFRWSFFGRDDIELYKSIIAIALFFVFSIFFMMIMSKKQYRLKN